MKKSRFTTEQVAQVSARRGPGINAGHLNELSSTYVDPDAASGLIRATCSTGPILVFG